MTVLDRSETAGAPETLAHPDDTRPAVAWCWRTGAIEVAVLTGRRRPPRGALVLGRAPAFILDGAICAVARHAYDGKTLLVPGVPEAESDDDALSAVEAFVVCLKRRLDRRQAEAAGEAPSEGGLH